MFGQFYSYGATGPSYNFTNNLMLRSKLSFTQFSPFFPISVNLYNNTFSGGQLGLAYNVGGSVWTVKDNLFDRLVLGNGTLNFVNSNNGYTTGLATYGGSSGGDKTGLLTPLDYQAGPATNWYGVEGKYYYPTTGGNLSRLLGPTAGSRPSAAPPGEAAEIFQAVLWFARLSPFARLVAGRHGLVARAPRPLRSSA